jgi:hypothetical protein
MFSGELSHDGGTAGAFGATSSMLTLTNVAMTQNPGLVFYAQSSTLTMRGCTITGNGGGVDAALGVFTDLGTESSPGNNIFQNGEAGLTIEGSDFDPPQVIQAIGNTWLPGLQGANEAGQYTTRNLIPGPVFGSLPKNFELGSKTNSLQL